MNDATARLYEPDLAMHDQGGKASGTGKWFNVDSYSGWFDVDTATVSVRPKIGGSQAGRKDTVTYAGRRELTLAFFS